MQRTSLRTLVCAAAGILITSGGCADIPTTGLRGEAEIGHVPVALSVAAVATEVAQVIGPNGGFVTVAGHTLEFPAGAVNRPTRITMAPMRGHVGAVFGPHGLKFPADAQPRLTFSYADGEVADASGLTVVYVGTGETFPTTVDEQRQTASAHVPHFSGYMLSGGRQQ